jgi:hypothetical protein
MRRYPAGTVIQSILAGIVIAVSKVRRHSLYKDCPWEAAFEDVLAEAVRAVGLSDAVAPLPGMGPKANLYRTKG